MSEQPPQAMTHGRYSKHKLLPMTEAKHTELLEIIKEQGLTLSKTDQWIVDTFRCHNFKRLPETQGFPKAT